MCFVMDDQVGEVVVVWLPGGRDITGVLLTDTVDKLVVECSDQEGNKTVWHVRKASIDALALLPGAKIEKTPPADILTPPLGDGTGRKRGW